MRLPAALVPGDPVRVIAPAGAFEPALGWRGLGWLASRYEVRYQRAIFSRTGYLAGDDERRLAELTAALEEPGVRAIVCARGGYGVSRIAHRVDWSALARAPRWIVGFSDVTALHVEASRVGVASMHGPNLTGLGRGDARGRAQLVERLEHPDAPRVWTGLGVVRSGKAAGPLVGGNLALLHACAAAGRLALPDDCVLLLEDIGERPYRIDRMLTTLRIGGHLRSVRGIVVGELLQCAAGADGVEPLAVIEETTRALAVPLVSGAPVGHGADNESVVLGGPVRLEATGASATLRMGG